MNFIAVTTVVLISADWDVREAFSLGRRAAGDMRQSFPRHSATTFLVPSSVHSVCLGRYSIQMSFRTEMQISKEVAPVQLIPDTWNIRGKSLNSAGTDRLSTDHLVVQITGKTTV